MQDERWKILCEEASTEQDPDRLAELIKEINDLIQAKHRRIVEMLKTPPLHSTPQNKTR